MKEPVVINPFLYLLNEKKISESVERKNMIYYSEFKQIFSKETFSNVGIKYVAEGVEYYKVGATEYKVKEKHFLLSSKIPGTHGLIDSTKPVKGICIDLDEETIKDVFQILSSKEKINLDISIDDLALPYFFEHISFAETSVLKEQLFKLENCLTSHNYEIPFVNDEWFFEFAEELICEQHEKWKSLNRLEFQRGSTKKEIIRRLLIGKEYIDIHFTQSLTIKMIAKYCSLSEFHFFRSFKDAFCITPYQYILRKKLELGLELLAVRKLNISQISAKLNFTDVQAFSNAFKKYYGVSPNKILSK